MAGSASLSGVLEFAKDQAPEPDARYTILTAGKGITGRFSRLETPYIRQPGSLLAYDTHREALNGTARGDTNGGAFDGYLSVGKDMRSGSLTLTPFASLLYTRTGIDEYDERGSLQPLQIESQSADSLLSRVGLRASQAFVQDGFLITPYASAEWQHELLDDAPTVSYRFSNGAGGTAIATGPEIGQHSLLASAGLQVAWNRYVCYLSYQANIGRENYQNQNILTGIQMSW